MKGPLILLPLFLYLKKDSASMIARTYFNKIPVFIIPVSTYTGTEGLESPWARAESQSLHQEPPPSWWLLTLRLRNHLSSFMHRLNSWNPTTDCPLTVVFHQALWDSPHHFKLSAKSICQGFLSLDTHLTGKVFCQKLNAWVCSLPRYTKKAVVHKDTHHALLYSIWKQSLHCIFLLLISVHYLIAPQNSRGIILPVI